MSSFIPSAALKTSRYPSSFTAIAKPGKQPAFRGPSQKKFTRIRSLKDGYSEGDILSIIVGRKELSPACQEMRDLQMEKANVARLLGYDEKETEKEKEAQRKEQR